jgi:hypothetical protein
VSHSLFLCVSAACLRMSVLPALLATLLVEVPNLGCLIFLQGKVMSVSDASQASRYKRQLRLASGPTRHG